MNTSKMQALNREYEPLRIHTHETVKALAKLGFECEWGYFAQHSIRNGDEWFFEHYPIPVITIRNICEIGFDLSQTFVEFKMAREEALKFDFTQFNDLTFEVYGVEDYLNDFHNTNQNIKDIHAKIEKSNEKEINISFLFGYLESIETTIKAIGKVQEILECLQIHK